jgi:hemolysin III
MKCRGALVEIKGIKWNYDRSELIADGVVHGIGLAFALIGVTAMIFYATLWSTSGQLVAAWARCDPVDLLPL